jgi:hypothetical protein
MNVVETVRCLNCILTIYWRVIDEKITLKSISVLAFCVIFRSFSLFPCLLLLYLGWHVYAYVHEFWFGCKYATVHLQFRGLNDVAIRLIQQRWVVVMSARPSHATACFIVIWRSMMYLLFLFWEGLLASFSLLEKNWVCIMSLSTFHLTDDAAQFSDIFSKFDL